MKTREEWLRRVRGGLALAPARRDRVRNRVLAAAAVSAASAASSAAGVSKVAGATSATTAAPVVVPAAASGWLKVVVVGALSVAVAGGVTLSQIASSSPHERPPEASPHEAEVASGPAALRASAAPSDLAIVAEAVAVAEPAVVAEAAVVEEPVVRAPVGLPSAPSIRGAAPVVTPEGAATVRATSARAPTEGAETTDEIEPDVADPLGLETALLRRARSALAHDEPSRALALLDEHATRFPDGTLGELRDTLRVRAFCAMGDETSAVRAAAELVARHPTSSLAPGATAPCGTR